MSLVNFKIVWSIINIIIIVIMMTIYYEILESKFEKLFKKYND